MRGPFDSLIGYKEEYRKNGKPSLSALNGIAVSGKTVCITQERLSFTKIDLHRKNLSSMIENLCRQSVQIVAVQFPCGRNVDRSATPAHGKIFVSSLHSLRRAFPRIRRNVVSKQTSPRRRVQCIVVAYISCGVGTRESSVFTNSRYQYSLRDSCEQPASQIRVHFNLREPPLERNYAWFRSRVESFIKRRCDQSNAGPGRRIGGGQWSPNRPKLPMVPLYRYRVRNKTRCAPVTHQGGLR